MHHTSWRATTFRYACKYVHQKCETPEQKTVAQRVREYVASRSPSRQPAALAAEGEKDGKAKKRRGRSSSRNSKNKE